MDLSSANRHRVSLGTEVFCLRCLRDEAAFLATAEEQVTSSAKGARRSGFIHGKEVNT